MPLCFIATTARKNAMNRFPEQCLLPEHVIHCIAHGEQKTTIASSKDLMVYFNKNTYCHKVPFTIYVDFESLIVPVQSCYSGNDTKIEQKIRLPEFSTPSQTVRRLIQPYRPQHTKRCMYFQARKSSCRLPRWQRHHNTFLSTVAKEANVPLPTLCVIPYHYCHGRRR